MDRAPIDVFNQATKVCVDCAHYIHDGMDGLFSTCGAAPLVDQVTGKAGFKSAAMQRIWHCGEQAIQFIPKADIAAQRSVRRQQLHRAIEDAIDQLRPDTNEAFELMHALHSALEARYDGRIPAVLERCDQLCVALEAADGSPA